MQRWIWMRVCVCLFSFILNTRLLGRFYSFDHVTIAVIVWNSCAHLQADSMFKMSGRCGLWSVKRQFWMVKKNAWPDERTLSDEGGQMDTRFKQQFNRFKYSSPPLLLLRLCAVLIANTSIVIVAVFLCCYWWWCWWLINGSWSKPPSSVSTTFQTLLNHHKHSFWEEEKKTRHVQLTPHILLV